MVIKNINISQKLQKEQNNIIRDKIMNKNIIIPVGPKHFVQTLKIL